MDTQSHKFEIESFSNYGMDGLPQHKYRVTGAGLTYSSNSVNKALNAIRKAINPSSGKKRKTQAEEIVKYLSREQTMAFLQGICKHHDQSVNKSLFDPVMWRALFVLSYRYGLRRSEVCAINVGDLKDGQRIYIRRSKGSISKEYYMTNDVYKHVKVWTDKRGEAGKGDPLFISTRGNRYTGSGIYAMFKTLAVVAGISDFSPHSLRHSIAIHMLEDDRRRLVEVKDLLGHASITSTQIYADIVDGGRTRYLKDMSESKFVVKP